MAQITAYHPTYKKYLPFKVTKIKNSSKYFRITCDENCGLHRNRYSFYWPRFKKYVEQIEVDFGTIMAVNQPMRFNRSLQLVQHSLSAGNFGVWEWKAPSGNWYAMLAVHTNKRRILTKAGDVFAHVAPRTQNGNRVPHTHLAFAVAYKGKNPKPIHYSKVLF